jgi:SAM-dependent methyltransferase
MSKPHIEAYQELYDELPFEETMAAIRKKTVLQFLHAKQSNNILEIGCGNDSILNHYTDFDTAIVAEPSQVFFSRLKTIPFPEHKEIVLINDFFSASLKSLYDFSKTDTVIVSGLLHELPHPQQFLKDVYEICNPGTSVHVNVPNANSFHRLLAVEAGLIKDTKELSALQIELKQPHTFSLKDLQDLAINCGFTIEDEGSYFIKPFTHKQMEILNNHDMFGEKIITGLENMIKYFPHMGAEIFLNLVK